MNDGAVNRAKRDAGYYAAELVEDGMVLGLGTGSTVFYAMERLSLRISEGLDIMGVPTSYQTAILARDLHIPLTTLDEYPILDRAIDGADQVDDRLCLIKGRGAALVREKCVAATAEELMIVVDPGKMTPTLNGPVPVEVIPFMVKPVQLAIEDLGGQPILREGVKKDGPVITDNGNFILDCAFGPIEDPERLEALLTVMAGVLGCGLFTEFKEKTTVLVGEPGACRVINPSGL
ncbi:MAG TPA: ribose-5-phosphate isomerase RpiA [Methanoregulaceae archaeon]|nr:ribose-5-phosphate isomerase RpiA [Methanoregulaceae archaeon]